MGLPHSWAYLNWLHLYAWERSLDCEPRPARLARKMTAAVLCGDDLAGSFESQ
jgi:hypothetical protein